MYIVLYMCIPKFLSRRSDHVWCTQPGGQGAVDVRTQGSSALALAADLSDCVRCGFSVLPRQPHAISCLFIGHIRWGWSRSVTWECTQIAFRFAFFCMRLLNCACAGKTVLSPANLFWKITGSLEKRNTPQSPAPRGGDHVACILRIIYSGAK